jgi:hypothetical protein
VGEGCFSLSGRSEESQDPPRGPTVSPAEQRHGGSQGPHPMPPQPGLWGSDNSRKSNQLASCQSPHCSGSEACVLTPL